MVPPMRSSSPGSAQFQTQEAVPVSERPSQPSLPPTQFPLPSQTGGYDEFRLPDGRVREQQQRLHDFVTQTESGELQRLRRVVRHRITEQEVTFNILGAPEGTNRPWSLDLLPHVVELGDWTALSAGLRQRARLLSAVAEDLFGPQRLLRERVIPPELVFGGPGYVRACHGWQPLGGFTLHLYASDIARGPDGDFRVYSDRTAAPTGSGYALENRLVLGRSLSRLFNNYGVERLRSYFDAVKRCVASLAPGSAEEPRVVVLSPGLRDESSFEHAYLARYLGYELVEGRDLTVRDRVLHMKTLSGLQRVDVVVRRVADIWCDPLSLREDSTLGVPGLVAAAAAGNVAILNPLGLGLCEAPAFKAYLPAACRRLLDQDLMLPSVDTWWCGEPASLQYVSDHLSDLVIKPAFKERQGEPWKPALMADGDRHQLLEKIKANPGGFVAERWQQPSMVPYFVGAQPDYGHLSLRTFLCRDDDDYHVMPGGLARINTAPDGVFLSLSGERATKDVWLPSLDSSEERRPPRMPDRRVELRRGGVDLPSRLLDDLYWLGRYTERCDMSARLLRAAYDRMSFEAGLDSEDVLTAIFSTLKALDVIPSTVPPQDDAGRESVLQGAIWDQNNPGSLINLCQRIHYLTVSVRSRLSRDAWHVFRRLGVAIPQKELIGQGSAMDLLDDVLVTLSAATGTTVDNMVRGHTWLFLDLGRRLERGALTIGLVQSMLEPGASRVHMEALLETADSLLTYRARYLSALQVAPVVDLVLTDDTNPRSLAFQVETLRQHIRELPRLDNVVRSRAERRTIAMQSALLTADVEAACAGEGEGLRELLEDTATLMWQLSDDITQTWFSHAMSSHAVSPPLWVNEELEAT